MSFDLLKQAFGDKIGTEIETGAYKPLVAQIAQPIVTAAVDVAKTALSATVATEAAKLPAEVTAIPEVANLVSALTAAINAWTVTV